MTIAKPLFRRETSEQRGRHLVAAAPLQQGQLIFCERPMIALQSTGNVHAGVLVCHYCMAFCGTPEQALEVAADSSCLPDISTTEHPEQVGPEHALIPCLNKCGQVYCSQECACDDWTWGGHKELCTGCIPDPEHPLLKFKQHAMQTNEIFLLVAQWIARIHNQQLPYHENDKDNKHPFTDFMMNPWWDVATLPLKLEPVGFAEAIELDSSCRRLCDESHAFLRAAWPDQKDSKWLTPLGMARLIGSLEQNCMGIRRKAALRRSVMEDTELRHKYHTLIIRCLERAGMIGEGEGDGDDDDAEDAIEEEPGDVEVAGSPLPSADGNANDNGNPATLLNPNEEWDYTYDEIAFFLANLNNPLNIGSDDEWDELFTPLDGTAHYSTATKMNHSCDPNVVVLYRTRGWGKDHPLTAYCVALRDIAQDEELTISYIMSDMPYEDRQRALANYGFRCECTKCQLHETAGAAVPKDKATALDVPLVEDLFGEESDDEGGTKDVLTEESATLDGESKLQNVVLQIETVLNKSVHAAIPLGALASVTNYTIQFLNSLLRDAEVGTLVMDPTVAGLLEKCRLGLKERDFSLCRIVGIDLESLLYSRLQKEGTWSQPADRNAFWCACISASTGFANEGSFLTAMRYLDRAIIVGLERRKIEEFVSYVEMFARQMYAAPCPPDIQYILTNYRSPEVTQRLREAGLSNPISHPVAQKSSADLPAMLKSLATPVVFRNFASDWSAISEWCSLDTLAQKHGHRCVPIELGSMLSIRGIQEQVIDLRSFVSKYLAPSTHKECWSLEDATNDPSNIAYLAQHPLLEQIPELYDSVERRPGGIQPVKVNVWIGTGGTRTPLHFDSFDNLLVQVTGAKYVRLYDTQQTPNLYVSQDSTYGAQGNMSQVNCEMENFDAHPMAKDCTYVEVLLLPGDSLYIPSRWWHYVRSLSTSISVNYWF